MEIIAKKCSTSTWKWHFIYEKNVQRINFKFIIESLHQRQVGTQCSLLAFEQFTTPHGKYYDRASIQTSNVRQSLIANAFQFLSLPTPPPPPQWCGWYENSIIFQYRCRLRASERDVEWNLHFLPPWGEIAEAVREKENKAFALYGVKSAR